MPTILVNRIMTMMMMTSFIKMEMAFPTLFSGRGALCDPRPNCESAQQHQQVDQWSMIIIKIIKIIKIITIIITGDWQRRTRQWEVTEERSHSQRLVNFAKSDRELDWKTCLLSWKGELNDTSSLGNQLRCWCNVYVGRNSKSFLSRWSRRTLFQFWSTATKILTSSPQW